MFVGIAAVQGNGMDIGSPFHYDGVGTVVKPLRSSDLARLFFARSKKYLPIHLT